ncbi:MAG: S8 family serine peptidase [Bacteriovoracaceae bacterium]|nr:S8 family serine peptidase [Bacteriovoracaceae bacterium]
MKTIKELSCKVALISALISISLSTYAVTNRVLVEFKKIPTQKEIDQMLKTEGIKSLERFDNVKLGKLEYDYFRRLFYLQADVDAIEDIKDHPKVAGIETIGEVNAFSVVPSTTSITTDTFSNYQWGIDNNGQVILRDEDQIRYKQVNGIKGKDIKISNVYSTLNDSFKAESVLVAVIDSGIDPNHPDLKNAIYRNKVECDESGNIIRSAREDKDNNGFKGDCSGWNFASKRGSNKPTDSRGHGTHVAGIIAASSSNGLGVASLAPAKIKILPIKIFNNRGVNLNGSVSNEKLASFTDVVAKAIRYAVLMKVQVINMSFGWPRRLNSKHLSEALKMALDNNIAIVTGAGNNDTLRPVYPCAHNGVICVGATSIDGSMAGFSNYGGFVDLTAPGEKILSTFPQRIELDDPRLEFTQKGYNYKNGTSQSAPFVSLAFAILKGIYPNSTNDSLVARLYETALAPSSKKFTKAGLIQIEDAININKKVSIKPIFKGIQTVHVNMNSKKFSFELPIKNYWAQAKNIKVLINIKSDSIKLEQKMYNINKLEESESKKLIVTGHIKSTSANSDNMLEVEITTQSLASQSYKHNVSFARDAISDQELLIKQISYPGPNEDLVEITEGKLVPTIETINDKYRDSNAPEYFASKVVENNLELSIFALEGNTFKAQKISLPNVTQIMTITRVDLNYDGQKDYFIRSIDIKSANRRDAYILYSFLDSNLKPLFNNPHFKFFPNTVIVDNTNINFKMNFIPVNTKHGKMAVPFFLAIGSIPVNSQDFTPWVCGEDRGRESERNPDIWDCEEEDISPQKHAYYLIPDFDNQELRTKLFDNYKFKQALESKFDLYKNPITLLGLASQDNTSFKNGRAIFQMAVGYNSYCAVTVSEDLKYEINSLNVGYMHLEGANRVPVTLIKDNKASYFEATGFTSLQNNTLAEFLFLDPQNPHTLSSYFNYEHARKRDHILAPLVNFIKGDTSYSAVQTKSTNVVRVSRNFNVLNTYEYPVDRVTFLPGSTFMEFFYPFTIKRKGELIPALYVDATDLNTGHVYFVGLTEDGPITTINNNIYIPENCTSMNQTSIDSKEAVALLCKEQDKLVFKYLPIQIND